MSYTTTVLIKGTKEQVFNAISKNIEKWWGKTDNSVSSVDEDFTTSFDNTYWKFKISEYKPNTKIVWKCIEAKHIHTGYSDIEKEWEGTFVVWTLKEKSQNETILHFAHNGLIPTLNCYDICFPAWENFVTKSLKQYVETGIGIPYLV